MGNASWWVGGFPHALHQHQHTSTYPVMHGGFASTEKSNCEKSDRVWPLGSLLLVWWVCAWFFVAFSLSFHFIKRGLLNIFKPPAPIVCGLKDSQAAGHWCGSTEGVQFPSAGSVLLDAPAQPKWRPLGAAAGTGQSKETINMTGES
jgi:hypothetical protein